MKDVRAKEHAPAPKLSWSDKTVAACFAAFNSTERGLELTDVVKRLKLHGPNALPEPKTMSVAQLFLKQFQSPLIYILLIASIVVLFLGDVADTIVILVVLLINAVIGVLQEGKAQNTLKALQNFTKTQAVAIRDGVEEVIVDEEIVPGDIIVLREGDKVPADARLFEVKNLRLDESALTGESEPVSKTIDVISKAVTSTADQRNMVFRGSLVVAGSARAIVVATGLNTVIGGISKKMIGLDTEIPLNKNIKILSRNVGIAVVVISALVFGIGVLYGNSIESMFFTSVAVAVSLVPEGLPVVITLVLSIGAYRMAKQNALVKNLAAVEALGQASVIAVDKTGTITKNELMIERVFVGGKHFSVMGNGYEPRGDVLFDGIPVDPANHPELIFAGKIATFCANARVMLREKEGTWQVAGDPTEAALLTFGEKVGFHKDELEQEEPQVNDLPFDSKLKYHATLHSVKKKSFLSVVGAPESVLGLSNQIRVGAHVKKLTEAVKNEIEVAVHAMSRQGLRVLAFAYVSDYAGELGVDPVHGVTLVGLFGLRDVMREGVRESVQAAQANGLRVVMITGDHKLTAETIAREAGIYREGDEILTGQDLSRIPTGDLVKMLPRVSVFARVSPEDKLDIIQLLKKNGDIIAMTGDGVNDALSLVAADLGIAMGKIGTEVSKEAADIVLLDDNFKSIVSAIDEGRNIFAGIKKVVVYLFSTGLGELFTVVGAMLFFLPPPVFPTQILWLNLVTDGFLVVALAFEPKERIKTRITPGGKGFFFGKHAVIRAVLMGLTMSVITIVVFKSLFDVDSAKAYT
ncbi:MAG TPA: cation-translocating P-type ATPase, partial [Candidatus Nanoarchaeia archaeon]|nr:cation-translocating P-type ATPase [Candidatus Nanoarchaeia archaeon]